MFARDLAIAFGFTESSVFDIMPFYCECLTCVAVHEAGIRKKEKRFAHMINHIIIWQLARMKHIIYVFVDSDESTTGCSGTFVSDLFSKLDAMKPQPTPLPAAYDLNSERM